MPRQRLKPRQVDDTAFARSPYNRRPDGVRADGDSNPTWSLMVQRPHGQSGQPGKLPHLPGLPVGAGHRVLISSCPRRSR
jgi:hypothetical protein